MSHHIYHTEAIILGTRPHGEGDRLLYCYTRNLGLVVAHARSIRESRSRLRYALQTFSHAHIDLVRGKHGWKLISATPITSFRALWASQAHRQIVANHSDLTLRLIQGEERHEMLFDDIIKGLTFLTSLHDKESLRDVGLLLVVRLRHALGYWGGSGTYALAAESYTYTEADLRHLRARRKEIVSAVNESLRSSQL